MLTKGEKSVVQFSEQHQTVLIFVVQFKTFEEIFVATLFFVFFHLSIDWQEFFEGQEFFAALLCAAQFFNQSKCWVAVECSQNIAKVIGIDLV